MLPSNGNLILIFISLVLMHCCRAAAMSAVVYDNCNGDRACIPLLRVVLPLPGWPKETSNVIELVKAGVQLLDDSGASSNWKLKTDIQITAYPRDLESFGFEAYPLDYSFTFQNAFEKLNPGCGTNGVCCHQRNQSAQLQFNSSALGAYRIKSPVVLMDIGVEVMKSNFSALSVLNPVSRPTQTIPGATVSIQWSPPQQVRFSNDYYSVVDTENPFDEGILILASHFGQGCNKLGITSNLWQTCYTCSGSFGSSTIVSGASPYDQLQYFRNNTFSHMCSQNGRVCKFVDGYPLSVASPDYQESQMTVDCGASLDQATVSIDVDGRTFGLVPWEDTSAGGVVGAILIMRQTRLDLLANVTNVGGRGNFSIRPFSCCSLADGLYTCMSNVSFSGSAQTISSGEVAQMTVNVSLSSDILQSIGGCQFQLVLNPTKAVQAVFYVPVTREIASPPPPASESPPAAETEFLGRFTLSFLPSANFKDTLDGTDMSAVKISLQYRLAAFFAVGIENVNASLLNTTSWQILVTSSATRQIAFTDILTACETDSFFRNYLLVAMSDIAWSPVLKTDTSDTADNSTCACGSALNFVVYLHQVRDRSLSTSREAEHAYGSLITPSHTRWELAKQASIWTAVATFGYFLIPSLSSRHG
eukprot:jgi/Botrbrau1/11356/Bobra.0038s0110.2